MQEELTKSAFILKKKKKKCFKFLIADDQKYLFFREFNRGTEKRYIIMCQRLESSHSLALP